MPNVSNMTTTANRAAELRERVEGKLVYGVKCTRGMNELARLEDEMRTPLQRAARKFGFGLLIVAGCASAYAPIVLPCVKFAVGS